MSKYQRIVMIIAAANIAIMFLFPPFLDAPLRRGALPNFNGFNSLVTAFGGLRIHVTLLTLEMMFVVINALVAWLALEPKKRSGGPADFRFGRWIAVFAAANIAFLMLFPPMESYSALIKQQVSSFDGFYFAFGDKQHRNLYLPLVQLEITLVVINALALWLLFNTLWQEDLAVRQRIFELARALPTNPAIEAAPPERAQYRPHTNPQDPHYDTGPDRRKLWNPGFPGPEHRHGGDRRRKPRSTP